MTENLRGINGRLDSAIEDQRALSAPLKQLNDKVNEALGPVVFPVKSTIVAQNVWYKEGEDLDKIASLIVHQTLNLKEIKILRVERKSGKESGSGLLKIELESPQDVQDILRKKRLLKDAPAWELREILLRQSKSEETLRAERNQDVLLREMGVKHKYVRLHTGYLAHRDHQYEKPGHVTNRGPNTPARGRGGGRGTRGRRGGNHGHPYRKWDGKQAVSHATGPVAGDKPIEELLG